MCSCYVLKLLKQCVAITTNMPDIVSSFVPHILAFSTFAFHTSYQLWFYFKYLTYFNSDSFNTFYPKGDLMPLLCTISSTQLISFDVLPFCKLSIFSAFRLHIYKQYIIFVVDVIWCWIGLPDLISICVVIQCSCLVKSSRKLGSNRQMRADCMRLH